MITKRHLLIAFILVIGVIITIACFVFGYEPLLLANIFLASTTLLAAVTIAARIIMQ
ncbi:hypothetical protein HN924_00755 [Candidatus Woesearchaeota archaeon]|jgi:hypothetical protein|nr:hypothetical protein [Candidatus Woesearchaeota archaeon]MBT7062483.1 hypothetical protein [Candidatus Woesearchaeota archaeon]